MCQAHYTFSILRCRRIIDLISNVTPPSHSYVNWKRELYYSPVNDYSMQASIKIKHNPLLKIYFELLKTLGLGYEFSK